MSMLKSLVAVSTVLVLCLFPWQTSAQNVQPTQYGVGFQATFPSYGLSGMMDITPTISAQGILGFFGSLKTYAVRGLYRFKRKDYWNLYGYGMIGAWSYTGRYYDYDRDWIDDTETTVGFGVGAGFEYDWRGWDAELPAIFWDFEIGLGFANFNTVGYDFSVLAIGGGVHYRF